MGHSTEPQETAGPSEGAISYMPKGASSIPPTDETPDTAVDGPYKWIVGWWDFGTSVDYYETYNEALKVFQRNDGDFIALVYKRAK